MLDIKRIRDEPEHVRERLAVRGDPSLAGAVDRALELDDARRGLVAEVDAMRARRNEVSPRVGELKREGKDDEAQAVIREMRELGLVRQFELAL